MDTFYTFVITMIGLSFGGIVFVGVSGVVYPLLVVIGLSLQLGY